MNNYGNLIKKFDELLIELDATNPKSLSLQKQADIRHYTDVFLRTAVDKICQSHNFYQKQELCD